MRCPLLFALVSCWWLLASPAARAETYAADLRVEDESDLRALYEDGVLSQEEFEALADLLRTGLELRTASREALYTLPGLDWAQVDALLAWRQAAGADWRLEQLVEAGVLTAAQLRQLRPFLREPERSSAPVSGRLRLRGASGVGESLLPAMLLQAEVEGPWGLRAGGGAVLTRRRLGTVFYDSRRHALVAELPSLTPQLPKLDVRWEGSHASLLAGTYRLGFGQRLTLDTTGRPAPEGFLPDESFLTPEGSERRCMLTGTGGCSADEAREWVTPDFGWTEGFRGLVGTVHGALEDVDLAFTGFGSYQTRGLVQYELMDRRRCPLATSECEAPEVLAVRPGQRVPGVARFVSRTLPSVFDELAGGGHVSVSRGAHWRVGVTAWNAWPRWTVAGGELDFREQARYPRGGSYGALGVDAAWAVGPVHFFLEGTRAFSAANAPGDAAVQRTVLGDRRQELELLLRYYGHDFANPYARPVSSPDEFEGLRASNERGARLRYLHRTEDGTWRLAGTVDVWSAAAGAASGLVHLKSMARADAEVLPELQPSVWVEYDNKQLGHDGPGRCFEGTEGTLEDGEPAPCSGERYRLAGRVRLEPIEGLSLVAQYQHTWVSSSRDARWLQQDGRALVEAILQPLPELRLHARALWQDEDLSENTRLTQTLRNALEVTWAPRAMLGVRARYELVLDLKAAEGALTPPAPPQHLVRLELDVRL